MIWTSKTGILIASMRTDRLVRVFTPCLYLTITWEQFVGLMIDLLCLTPHEIQLITQESRVPRRTLYSGITKIQFRCHPLCISVNGPRVRNPVLLLRRHLFHLHSAQPSRDDPSYWLKIVQVSGTAQYHLGRHMDKHDPIIPSRLAVTHTSLIRYSPSSNCGCDDGRA